MKIGLYVPHDPHVFQPIEWKHLVLNLACLGAQEMKKELEKHGRDMRMKVHIVYSHTDMPQGIFLCTLNLLLCHSSVMGICCPGQYMKKQSSMAIYMLSIKSETAWKRRTGVMVGCTVACRFIANAGRVKLLRLRRQSDSSTNCSIGGSFPIPCDCMPMLGKVLVWMCVWLGEWGL